MKLLLTFLISSLGLATFSCDTTKKTTETITAAQLSGSYKIVEILGYDYTEEDIVMEIETATNTFNAKTPCNSVFGKFTMKGGSLQFQSVGATKMYCEGKMQAEKELAAALQETGALTKERGVLILYSAESDEVVIRAIDILERDGN